LVKNDEDKNALTGYGAPALLSPKEPAIRKLKERYSDSFAVVPGLRKGQVHLFLIKYGLWALVETLTPRDFGQQSGSTDIAKALRWLEKTLNSFDGSRLDRLDQFVRKAKERIQNRADEFHYP
jgi:hypothetical protein